MLQQIFVDNSQNLCMVTLCGNTCRCTKSNKIKFKIHSVAFPPHVIFILFCPQCDVILNDVPNQEVILTWK